ncbi:glycoside hydrolase family 5 protein [Glaciimonas sp. Gout2]|uniref:glycoside hydrolase family 5 protein n=1 Tax=unclassified Glaciimonas TaxID=2644401 RepID=UPI002B23C299|nr:MULTISPECIES: glycoside hydrolase family 5 protein [unclassified Glaciimonas]MEB0010820.1 glycoside hydrolase family 5 protein [Glaciimonas sp. Cout2]MEB0081601.1 glycoside hydrolase family 5 protein [Glaciimonas sp. Gout2]
MFLAVLAGCFAITHGAVANCIDSKRLTGVNLSGAEFAANKLPGLVFHDYIYPDIADMRHFQSQGMNTFRLPFLWERIQPALFGDLDAPQLKLMMDTVADARLLDVCIILDVHNYGEYRGQPIGSVTVPPAALVDLWKRLLPHFTDPTNVAFDLMNEPSKLPIAKWAATAQETVDALRKNGAKNLILVAGGSWSGAHAWFADASGVSNADAFRTFHDAANNYLIETHQYADEDFSGTHNTCVDPAILTTVMSKLTKWAISTQHRLFLGEVGVYPTSPCLAALAAIVNSTKNASAWRGWTYWSTGPWLAEYPYNLLPDANGEKPQMAVLKQAM